MKFQIKETISKNGRTRGQHLTWFLQGSKKKMSSSKWRPRRSHLLLSKWTPRTFLLPPFKTPWMKLFISSSRCHAWSSSSPLSWCHEATSKKTRWSPSSCLQWRHLPCSLKPFNGSRMKKRSLAPWGSKKLSSSPPSPRLGSSKKLHHLVRPREGERGWNGAAWRQPWGVENEGEERGRGLYIGTWRGVVSWQVS